MGDCQQYAEVLINKNIGGLYKTFQYKITESQREKISIGSRVIIPFGSSLVDGFVIGLTEKAKMDKIKDIYDVVDSDLAYNSEMIEVAKWMSEQYLSPLVLCLRCFLPLGSISKINKYIFLGKNVDIEGIDGIEREIVEYVQDNNKVLLRTLQKKFNSAKAIIKKLRQQGVLKEEVKLESGIKEKKIKKVYLSIDKNKALNLIGTRAKKQREIISFLTQNNGVLLKELVENVKCNYTTVRTLHDKGIIDIQNESKDINIENKLIKRTIKTLSLQQKKVLTTLQEAFDNPYPERFLLYGVTGSGKTEVYVRLVQYAIKKGKQAIVLVPEITLTLNLIKELRAQFGSSVAVLHSGITPTEKYAYWQKIKKGECKVVVGARSAIFAPCNNLGLIIIDEEHEWTYKQDVNPKYHTREIAWKRAQLNNSILLLGSATPALETFWRTEKADLKLLQMPNRINNNPLPQVEIVDMTEEIRYGNYSIFSRKLLQSLYEVIKNDESAMILVTRRGLASFVLCKSCGFVLECPNCSVTLTLHKEQKILQCHYCHYQQALPNVCPQCRSKNWRPYGVGTQKVEEELDKMFTGKVIRVDSDSTAKKGVTEELLNKFAKNGGIMVGTQMIAKGLHFPNVTLVGVIDTDNVLKLPDYRARERNFQLLTQVAGRAGRGSKKGQVVIQTYNPQDLSIIMAQKHDYLSFYKEEKKERRFFNYPPFVHIIQCLLSHSNEEKVEEAAKNFKGYLLGNLVGFEKIVTVLGPAPSSMYKLNKRYRWQITLKSKNLKFARKVIAKTIHSFYQNCGTSVRVEVDINPVGLI